MLNERTIELIHLRIDGQASPSEVTELAAILDSSPEARASLEGMEKLAMVLESAPLLQAPATLKKDVLAGIPQKRPSRFQWTRTPRGRKSGSATNFPTNRVVLTTEPGTDGLTDGWRQRMNSQKKRNFLIAFGGVAVVLVAVFATWPPAFLSEDASGAIGAVQKHRAPQITAKDVVLVDEATRREEDILYADYLKDAGKLEDISVDLRSSDDNLEARSRAARNVQGHVADLQGRYRLGMSDALNAANQLLARNAKGLSARQIAGIQSDIDSLSAKIQARQELGDEEIAALNIRLRSINDNLAARSAGVRSLENVAMALGTEIATLEKARLESGDLLDAKAARVESLSRDIQEARFTVDARQRQDHLGALNLELRALKNADSAIEAISRNTLGENAELGIRLRSASDDLAGHANRLESQAIDNMQSRLKAYDEMAARIKSMDSTLESARKALAGRSQVESRFSKALGSFDDDLQALNVRIQARISAGIQSELGAIATRLDSRQMNVRFQNEVQLEARQLQDEAQLGARLESRNKLGARLSGHLGALTQALDAKSNIGARLRDQAELGKQARALQNRADIELQARQK